MSQQPLDRSESEVTLLARKDLDPEVRPVLVESSIEKVVAEIRRQQAVNPGGMSQTLIPAE